MKVLMFGWEFPPHISGGLGTACHGLTKGLANNGVEVALVKSRQTSAGTKHATHVGHIGGVERAQVKTRQT